MPIVIFRIFCLLHTSQQHGVDHHRFRFICNIFHDFCRSLGVMEPFVCLTTIPNAEAKSKSAAFFFFWFFMDPINERQSTFVEMLCHCFISSQHKGLNQSFANSSFAKKDVLRMPCFVNQYFGFTILKRNCPRRTRIASKI